MCWFIVYSISIIIVYILQRYYVISGKGFMATDDPQIVSFIIAIFWPYVFFACGLFKIGEYIDKVIKSKVNEKVNRSN